jgi:hypothetical protein
MNDLNDPFAGQAGSSVGEYMQPHRGGKVLVFGILGIALCFIFGILAWTMGNKDLAAMDSGKLDPAGRGKTRAGLICGKIGAFVNSAYLIFMIFYIAWIVSMVTSAQQRYPAY